MGTQGIRDEPGKVVRLASAARAAPAPARPEPRPAGRPPAFAALHDWLLTQALQDVALEDIVGGLGRRLVAAGVPLYRLSIGGVVLHPVYGTLGTIWDADTDRVRSEQYPRSAARTPEFQNSPFFLMASRRLPFRRFRLDGPAPECDFPVLDRLRQAGVTDYITFFHGYGRADERLWAELPPGLRGANISFATRRAGGFTDREIEQLRALSVPLAAAIKTSTHDELSRALLDTYLGRTSGEHVLRGHVERGDSRLIDCVLWYCDLRGSTALAESMALTGYLAALNEYFDCAAGAVLDHGGEVLKYVGDAVMAIFPFDETIRSPVAMCNAALMAALDARARIRSRDADSDTAGRPPIEIDVALHVGQVLYGNVGTARRLDFTVIGPAVNEAVRLEKLCKELDAPIVASARFRELCDHELVPLGRYAAAGVPGGLEAFAPAE